MTALGDTEELRNIAVSTVWSLKELMWVKFNFNLTDHGVSLLASAASARHISLYDALIFIVDQNNAFFLVNLMGVT